MRLTFLGGAGTVTGSRFAVETERGVVLVDCGMFQGPREIRERNWDPFPLAPSSIEAVVLTHAHLDHCGYLPALVRDGFTGPVLCSPNTARLVPIILRDSARLQEEDTAYARKKGYSRHAQPRELYDSTDAEAAIALLHPVEFGDTVRLHPDLTCRLDPAGHILGSATVTLMHESGRRLAFSGDLGRDHHPLLDPPVPPVDADVIVLESTYGDRAHADVDAEIDELADAITRTLKRKGTVLIPAFAVDRTEVILVALKRLQDHDRIPIAPITVDSPMALAAHRVYVEAIADADEELLTSVIAEGPGVIQLGNLHEAHTPDDSKLLDKGGARIIVSASGMGTGGRVTHHLKALLPDPDNTVILVGYQAQGTPGRMLADGAERIRIHGKDVSVRAEIVNVEAFSVHADADELIDWIKDARTTPDHVYLVHGEPESSAALAERITAELKVPATPAEHLHSVDI